MVRENVLHFKFNQGGGGGSGGSCAETKGKKNKDKTIFCATNYPKEFMKILHGWTESVIRFIKVKQNVARNYQTSLGG